MNNRAIAASIITEVTAQRKSLNDVFNERKQANSDGSSLLKELCYGTLRWYFRLKPMANYMLDKPLPAKHELIQNLILVGLYQLIYLRIPDHAAVSETVAAAKELNKKWSTALINKILRRFIREKDTILAIIDTESSQRQAHPSWLVEQLQKAWPNKWEDILSANNIKGPMSLRVNPLKSSAKEYLSCLEELNIPATILPDLPQAIQLTHPLQAEKLPNFENGYCYIQDQAGQNSAQLLDLKPGQRVLDACAAPGSKTTQIMETEPELEHLVAIDKDPKRLILIKQNIDRLDLAHEHVQLVLADTSHTKQWWTGKQFDRILLDAPCSATGVIRRHPDIKLLRKPDDIIKQANVQTHLLNELWPLLKKDGKLLYSTCSILPTENESVISAFLSRHKNAKSISIKLPGATQTAKGAQFLPTEEGPDGFYYSLLTKTA
jgi:16S rRNA (cytosine967-C5)-methyltransferase